MHLPVARQHAPSGGGACLTAADGPVALEDPAAGVAVTPQQDQAGPVLQAAGAALGRLKHVSFPQVVLSPR